MNDTPTRGARCRHWLLRWQEFLGWAPLIVIAAFGAWAGLAHLAARYEHLRVIMELPVLAAHAALAAGFAHLTWLRWRYRLDEEQQARLWAGVMGGHRGPLVAFVVNAVVRTAHLVLWLCFFWPTR